MIQVAHAVMLSSGWKRALIAFLAGALAAAAMPPLDLIVALGLSLPVAIWLIDGAVESAIPGERGLNWPAIRMAGAIGWCFGFGYFLAGLWWLGAAFLVETDQFLWLMPFGVIGLPAGLALFHAVGFALARCLWMPGAGRILAFAFAMAAVEWLRGNILTGFPWNLFGQAFGAFDVTAQVASLIGLDGLNVLALLIFAAPAVIATGASARARWSLPVLALAALAVIVAFGTIRLGNAETGLVPGVKLRIVQANISERDKLKPGSGQATLSTYLSLSDRATAPGASGIGDVTHLIWPESAFPFILANEPRALAEIGAFLPPGTTLITGAVRTEPPRPGKRLPRYFNALQVVDSDGVITQSYDKVHLVPFGEYLPAEPLLSALGLRKFVPEPGDFEAGPKRRLLDVPGLPPVLPLICYEAVFPYELTSGTGRPGVMINVTNDAWFGETFGPYQHFAEARLRAVEQGVPLVRAANTGISGVVDAYGRVLHRTTLGARTVLDAGLPRALAPTLFARLGGLVFAGMMALLLLGVLTLRQLALRVE